jgi:hypothetical protein
VKPTKRGKRKSLTADQLWAMHENLTDEITVVLKHITTVNFHTPFGCLGKMFELSGAEPFLETDMIKSLIETFSVSISF